MNKFFIIIVEIYAALAILVFTPYFNWQYAKEHGFLSWLLLGEIIPTAKGLLWPLFLK